MPIHPCSRFSTLFNFVQLCLTPTLVALLLPLLVVSQTTEAEQLLEKMHTQKNIVGIAAGYSVDGNVEWKNAFGYSNLEEQIPFTEVTLTRTASIAKSMTAIAIMQLVEQGLIDLDKPIQNYIPDFPQKAQGVITVRHLLSHTSGLDGYKSSKETENQKEYPNLQEAMRVFENRDLKFEPGTSFFYTTYGYVVLGVMIENISGLTFEAYMQQNIWDKAGMTNTGVEHFNANYQNKSELYHSKKGKTKAAKKNNLSNRTPGGGFYTTLNDMIKFGNAVLDESLLKATTFQLMTENQFPEKEGNPYALGWFLYAPSPNENVVIGHSGEQTGAATQLFINRQNKTVVVVLANTSGTWKEVVMLASEVMNKVNRKM